MSDLSVRKSLNNAALPHTEADGRARFIRLAVEVEHLNGNSEKPKQTAKHVDAVVRQAVSWPVEARRGFTAMLSRWMVDYVLGATRMLEEEKEEFGASTDGPYFARLSHQYAAKSHRIAAREVARRANKAGCRARAEARA